jgi:hypothetical protein
MVMPLMAGERRSLAQQAFALRARFPETKARLTTKRLDWTGELQPAALSRTYRVRVTYELRAYPKVTVLSPRLESRPGKSLPHVFADGSLCLHLEDDWNSGMLLVDTIVPWTSEWLIQYEIWKFTGEWYGGGEWPPTRRASIATEEDVMLAGSRGQTVAAPTEENAMAERGPAHA